MELLEYYMLVNLYVLFFWIFFHLVLKNETAFQQLRIYLIASAFVSLLLPFLHINSQSFNSIYSQIPRTIGFIEITGTPSEILPIKTSTKPDIDYALILKCLILTGSLLFLALNLIKHIKIHSLVNKSECIRYRDLHIKITTQPIIPFLYNKFIIIPQTISKEEMNIVVDHEYQHYKFGHYIDNFILQIIQIIFWINPFVYLLIRDLKQIHEYQVDREVIKSGIDASIYKLTLIKYSVGFQKFAIANGLSNYKIKNRIIMMSNLNTKKWKWKFILFIPAFFVVFLSLSFTTSDKDSPIYSVEQQINNKSIELIAVQQGELRASNDREFITVNINRNSQLLLNGEKSSFDNFSERVNASYQHKVSDLFRQLDGSLISDTSPKVKIVVKRSAHTNQDDYNKLLDYLSKSIFSLQENFSNKLFDKSYDLLDSSDKEVVHNLVQPRLYTLPDINL
jgi:beta-lactamase regulating signal transducer with metallopeptidase domain/biopolymer transport protein ExbD